MMMMMTMLSKGESESEQISRWNGFKLRLTGNKRQQAAAASDGASNSTTRELVCCNKQEPCRCRTAACKVGCACMDVCMYVLK